MLKLTKKADYGLIAMRHLAQHADLGACSSKDLAEIYSMPQEALAKILQKLTCWYRSMAPMADIPWPAIHGESAHSK